METKQHLDPDDLQRPDWNSLQKNYDKHDVAEAYFRGRADEMGLHIEHWGIDRRHEDENLIFDNKMDLRLWKPMDGQSEPPRHWPRSNENMSIITTATVQEHPLPPQPAREGVETLNLNKQRWELSGIVDVKSKSSEDWLGICNVRHLAHYADHAETYDAIPTLIYFTMVDTETETVGDRNIVVRVPTDWDYKRVIDHYNHDIQLPYDELTDTVNESAAVDRVFRAPDGNTVVAFDQSVWRDMEYFRDVVDS